MKRISKLVSLLVLFLNMQMPASAELIQIRPGVFGAGIPKEQFDYRAATEKEGKQRQSNWCWAACIQMVLNYHGLLVKQEQIVAKVYGQADNKPATVPAILAALDGWAPDERGRFSAIHASPYVMTGSTIVRDLAYRWPLIVGLLPSGQKIGHIYVLTGVYYAVNPYNNEPIFLAVVLRDPWPGRPSHVVMPWAAFQRDCYFMVRVGVTRMQ